MEHKQIKEKILDLLSGLFADSEIDRSVLEYVDLVDDLGMDSINFISLIVELESTFQIKIPDEWMLVQKFQTYSLIENVVEALISAEKAEEIVP